MTIQEIMTGLKEWLLNKFAQKDGDYVSLNSGTANDFKKIGGGAEEGWLYRKCPQNNIGTGARLEKIKGKTLAWNQQANKSNTYIGSLPSGITVTNNNDGSFTINGTAAANGNFRMLLCATVGHKTLFSSGTNNANIRVGDGYSAADLGVKDFVKTAQNTQVWIYVMSGATYSNVVIWPMATDLTLLYGSAIDGMTDAEILAKFESEFPGYHSYEPGKLISNDAESIETVGFNQWDEEMALGTWEDDGTFRTGGTHDNYIACVNKIPILPNTTYYVKRPTAGSVMLFFDAGGNIIPNSAVGMPKDSTFTSSSGAYYVVFYLNKSNYGHSTYNHNICINLSDPAKNGTYEPYRKSTMQLGLNSIKVKSHNIWDEEWEFGSIDDNGVDVVSSAQWRSKNHIPVAGGTTLYFKGTGYGAGYNACFYTEQNVFISKHSANWNGTVDVPSNAAYMRFRIWADSIGYQNDICINVSSSFNGQYEPHGILTKTELGGNDGWSDMIVGNKLTLRRKRVDMGTLSYDKQGLADSKYGFNADVPGIKPASASSIKIKVVCSKYITGTGNEIYTGVVGISGWSTQAKISVYDPAYESNTAAQFKTAMSGVFLDYELATPIEYELVDAIPYITQYSEYGTQRIISPQSSTPSAPFMGEWQYGIQQGDFISGLENSEFMIGSSSYIISEEEFNEIFGNL